MLYVLISLVMAMLPLSALAQTGPVDPAVLKAERYQRPRRQQTPPEDPTTWRNKTIMCVMPHEDDEASSLGTLGLLKANGNKIVMVWYTTGNKGTRDLTLSGEKIAAIRKAESENACAEMGITPQKLYFHLAGIR